MIFNPNLTTLFDKIITNICFVIVLIAILIVINSVMELRWKHPWLFCITLAGGLIIFWYWMSGSYKK